MISRLLPGVLIIASITNTRRVDNQLPGYRGMVEGVIFTFFPFNAVAKVFRHVYLDGKQYFWIIFGHCYVCDSLSRRSFLPYVMFVNNF